MAVIQSGNMQSGRGTFLVEDDLHWGNGSFSMDGWSRGGSVYWYGGSESVSEYPVKVREGGVDSI